MPVPVTPWRHRAQMFGAIFLSVGSVFVASRVLKHHPHHACHGRSAAPVLTAFPAAPILSAPSGRETIGNALKRAAAEGDISDVKRLLDLGDPHYGELDNDAPLLLADARPEITQLLLDRGVAEPDLATACIAGAPNAVARILAKGASPNPDNGTTPLYDALETTVPSADTRRVIVEKLLAAGANVNAETVNGDVPLVAAIGTCDGDGVDACLGVIRMLEAKGATTSGATLGAALASDARVVDELLSHSLEPGATAIALANTATVDAEMVRKLARHGVAWSWHDGDPDGVAPLLHAVESNDVDMVRTMLEAGAPADLHYKDGRCALAQAIDDYELGENEAARIVELLLSHGANANRRFPDGRSPLFAAAEVGVTRMVNALLAAGARVNDKVLDETPLDAAERSGHTAVARVLDAHGGHRAKPTE